jgi:hypothetical protein
MIESSINLKEANLPSSGPVDKALESIEGIALVSPSVLGLAGMELVAPIPGSGSPVFGIAVSLGSLGSNSVFAFADGRVESSSKLILVRDSGFVGEVVGALAGAFGFATLGVLPTFAVALAMELALPKDGTDRAPCAGVVDAAGQVDREGSRFGSPA